LLLVLDFLPRWCRCVQGQILLRLVFHGHFCRLCNYSEIRKSRTSSKLRIRMGKDTTQRQERTADRLILHATSKHGRRLRVRKIIKQEKHYSFLY
jgi:hypothetical protein